MNTIDGFERACALLPMGMRVSALALPDNIAHCAEEIRLRAGYPPTVLAEGTELSFPGAAEVTYRELTAVLELATGASVHTAQDSIKRGFVTVRGGCRVGLCGTAVIQSGAVTTLRELSSISIRIPSERLGCADALIPGLFGEKRVSALIVSPPGYGKTTLLRELVRASSSMGMRVSLADERGEIAACWSGRPQLDVGPRTDIMTGAPKAQSAMMLLRAMNPQILALDEITDPEDAKVCLSAINCGVTILASAHADSVLELSGRAVFSELLGFFQAAVIIGVESGKRVYRLERL